MTPLHLAKSRAVVRETRVVDHRTNRPLVVRLELGGRILKIRPKGAQTWYVVAYEQIFVQGARNLHAARQAEKLAARKAKQKAKGR